MDKTPPKMTTDEMYASKLSKLKQIKSCLKHFLNFLKDYLPLANAHSNAFITNNMWENFLPEKIRTELCALSDENLIDLMGYLEKCKEKDDIDLKVKQDSFPNESDENHEVDCVSNKNEVENSSAKLSNRQPQKENCVSRKVNIAACTEMVSQNSEDDPNNWKFSCPYLDSAPKMNNKCKPIRGFTPSWVHKELLSFLHDADTNTIEKMKLALNLTELFSKYGFAKDEDKIFIPRIMTLKKSHEVDIMAEVCSLLAKHHGINTVVDMGSGKGYLSTQLALQHRLVVIGVDARPVNTVGAQKRADRLGKHWDGLVKNATEDKNRGYKIKRSKKWKKKMKVPVVRGDDSMKIRKDERDLTNSDILDGDDLIPGFHSLFNDSDHENVETDNDRTNKELIDVNYASEDVHKVDQSGVKSLTDTAESEAATCSCEILSTGTQNALHKQEESAELEYSNFVNIPIEALDESKIKSGKNKPKHVTATNNLFPVTMFVDSEVNLTKVVDTVLKEDQLLTNKESSLSRALMLTGLHTCGGLGTSTLQLFVNNPQAKVLCNVACCYHLMEEEFVCAPFEKNDGSIEELPGFPLSRYLKGRKVGLGRDARNFASQSVKRMAQQSELKSKSFPRSLLQKIILDINGYTKDDWKGLRKLDEKSDNMFDYVHKAFCKFGLPTDKLTPQLVSEYVDKYKEEERKLAAFHNVKMVLSPCIEAVVILDRMCYLLEQDNVADVDLVQLFDPVTSPRCYGIIATKNDAMRN